MFFLLFVLFMKLVYANITPIETMIPAITMFNNHPAWGESTRNTYIQTSEHGYSLSANNKFMLSGCGPTTGATVIVTYMFNSTSNTYNIIQHLRANFYESALAISSVDSFILSRSGENIAMLVSNSNIDSATQKSLPATQNACDYNNYPCDNVHVSDDAWLWVSGWPSYTTSNRNGFVRAHWKSGTTFYSVGEAWFNGNTTSNPSVVYGGRDSLSRFGSSVSTATIAANSYILVAGGPGNTMQTNGVEYPLYDYGGNNGDHRYGGYAQVFSMYNMTDNLRALSRFWAPDGHSPSAVDNKFGAIVRLTPDASKLLVTAPGTTLDGVNRGAFYIYENVNSGFGGRIGYQLFKGPYYGPGVGERFGWSGSISSNGNEIVIGAPFASNQDGKVYRYTYMADSGDYVLMNTFVDTSSGLGGNMGHSVWLDGPREKLYAGAPRGTSFLTYTNVGKMNIFHVPAPTASPTASPTVDPGNPTRRPTKFPTGFPTGAPTGFPTGAPTGAPTSTPPCDTTNDCVVAFPDRICERNVMGCVRIPCVTHNDCFPHTLQGRLPFCEPKSRRCIDTGESTCTTASTCSSSATVKQSTTNAISKTSISVREVDSLKRLSAANLTVSALRDVSPTYTLIVSSTETITMAALTNKTTEEMIAAVKTMRCGTVEDMCSISIVNRRMLDEGDLVVTVQFDMDDSVYAELIANGTNFADPTFVSSISALLGVDPTEIALTDNGGVITVKITLVDISVEGTPIEENALAEFQSIVTQLSNITSQIATDLGIESSSFDEPVVDLCGGERSCTNRGTCDNLTGICSCVSPAFYGINCELVTPEPTVSPTLSPTLFPTLSPTLFPTLFPTRQAQNAPTPYPTTEFPHDTIGFTSVTLNINNFTNLSLAAVALKDSVKSESTRFTFMGKQKFTLPLAVYNVDPDQGFIKGAIEGTRGCPPRTCVTTFEIISRRALTSSENFIVEVSYTLTEEAFQNIYLDGDDFSNSMFARRLEVELGLAEGTITVSTISNSVVVQVEVITTPTDGLPSDPQVIELLQSTKSLLDTQTDIVFGVFGVDGDDVTKTTLDLCTGREACNEKGTCNPLTGVCTCVVGWLGINCQTECICLNGGECSTGKCQCLYPYFGVLCEQMNDGCTTCSA